MNLESVIDNCILFLNKEQNENGEFPTYLSMDVLLADSMYVKSPFITTFVIHALQFLDYQRANAIKKKSLDFILSSKEDDFTWKFFKDKDIPNGFIYKSISPDIDDTSCALICLKRENLEFDDITDLFLKLQQDNGRFFTYFKEWKLPTDSDCVANANILYLFSLLNNISIGKNIHTLCNYLKQIVKEDSFSHNTLSYESYLAFTYALSRAYKYGNQFCLEEVKDIIVKNARSIKVSSPLDAALLTLTRLNFGDKFDEELINYIIRSQDDDGGFLAHRFFSAPRDFHGKKVYFGSRGLTTALVLEALVCYGAHNALENIDRKLENPKIAEQIVINRKEDKELAKTVSDLVRYEGRYACFLDLYAETDHPIYLYEGEHQHRILLQKLIEHNLDTTQLQKLEESARTYFELEKNLIKRIKHRETFSEEKIREYISRKSSDAYCYSWILQQFVADYSLPRLLHVRQALSDILDDTYDYENDLKQYHPNILLMHFSPKQPLTQTDAIREAKKVNISPQILHFSNDLFEEARSLGYSRFPILKESIEDKYFRIKNILK